MNVSGLLAMPTQGLLVLLLILTRASAIFLIAPLLGHTHVPARVKVGLAFLLAVILTPLLMPRTPALPVIDLWGLVTLLLQEMILGIIMGLLVQLVFIAFQFAGQIVGQQMGFGMANVLDPQTSTQVSVSAQVYMIVGSLIYLTLDGHLWMLMALERSLRLIPIGQFHFDGRSLSILLDASNELFLVTLLLVAPVMGVLILADVGLGIVARIMPQMNIFVASFPIKVGLGILTLAVSLPILVEHMGTLFAQNYENMIEYLRAWAVGAGGG